MPILYAAVAHGAKVVAREGHHKDFDVIVDALLQQIPRGTEQKKSYVHQGYIFNYVATKDGYVFVCVADKDHPGRVCFAFLHNLQEHFQPSASSRFGSYMKKQMAIYSDAKGVDKIEAIKRELDDVKDVMRENIDKVVQRGDKLSELETKTSELESDASMFRGRATKLKQAVWWNNLRMKIIIGIVLVVVIFVIIWIICGIDFSKCGAGSSPPPPPPPPPPPSPMPAPLSPGGRR